MNIVNNEAGELGGQLQSSTEQSSNLFLEIRMKLYKYRGAACILLASFSFALENVLFRAVENDMFFTMVTFSTYLLKVGFLLPVITHKGYSLKPSSKQTYIFLIGRGFLGMIAFNSMYFAVRYIKVGDATAIILSSIVFVGIFARIFLKEAFGIIDAFLTLVVVAGVFLISKPSFIFGGSKEEATSNLIGASLASLASICCAGSFLLNRQLGLLQINSFVNVLYYLTMGLIGSGILTSVVGVWSSPPCGYVRLVLVTMGVIGCAGNCLRTYSYSVEKALLLGILQTNETIFAYFLEFLLFDVAPDLIALLGVCLIVLASLMTLIKNRHENRS